jgi:hypothetical protein
LLYETDEFTITPCEDNKGFWPVFVVLTKHLIAKGSDYMSKAMQLDLKNIEELLTNSKLTNHDEESIAMLEQASVILQNICRIAKAPFKVNVVLSDGTLIPHDPPEKQ